MNRVLVVLLALVLLTGAALWFTLGGRDARRSELEQAPPPAAHTEATPVVETPAPATHAAEPALDPDSARQAGARAAVPSPHEAELARAQWVEGKVLFPPGTPPDEQAFVVARGKDFADGSDERAKVNADGSFRVAFSADTRAGWLALEARYLFLEQNLRWQRSAAGATITLAPRLGGRIEGKLVPPAGVERKGIAGTVSLSSSGDDPIRSATITDELAFAFGALDGALSFDLDYDGEAFVAPGIETRVAPGAITRVEFILRPGVILAGHVRDESGAPLADVDVSAGADSPGSWTRSNDRDGTTDAAGAFRIGGLASGEVKLVLALDGFQSLEHELGTLEAGTERMDIELVLTRGNSITGSVSWPDGTPAEAALTLAPEIDGPHLDATLHEVQAESDARGHFELTGLGSTLYRLEAKAVRTEEVKVTSAITGKERTKKQRTNWMAEVEHVKPGTRALAVTLSLGLELAGRVVDERGAPVLDFTIASEHRGEHWGFDDPARKSFHDADGAFRVAGFARGEWEVRAEGRGFADSVRVNVSLPATEPIVLVLPHEARISGTVVDARGAPIARAGVNVDRPGRGFTDLGKGSARDGGFEIVGLAPGHVSVYASAEGHAPSEPVELELAAGEQKSAIVLRLRDGGTILGEVFGIGGRPEAGVNVSADVLDLTGDSSHQTDVNGRFEIRGVAPGEHHLNVQTSSGLDLHQDVTVVDGETVHVRLAAPDGVAVRVHGRVRAGDAPLAGSITASHASDEDRNAGGQVSSRADADGAYELTLPGGGAYTLGFSDTRSTLWWQTSIDVPAVADFPFDLVVPLARIAGRVTDAQGEALAGIAIEAEPTEVEESGGGAASASTDAEGRYELVVPGGRLTLTAGGADRWNTAKSTPYAAARREGLLVHANDRLSGIDFVLQKGGTLAGHAHLADGSPATLFDLVAFENGTPRDIGWGRDGAFEIAGLAPGPLSFTAAGDGFATRSAMEVVIEAGKTTTVELELVRATRVHVRVNDAAGAPVDCDITAVDASAHPVVTLIYDKGEAWLGPLIAGRYTVRAQRDGKTIERALVLDGSAKEQELALTFE